MRYALITSITVIICFCITGASIVGLAYAIENPKVCPAPPVIEKAHDQ